MDNVAKGEGIDVEEDQSKDKLYFHDYHVRHDF